MIARSYIINNLNSLNRRYQKTSGKEAQFCSKLALIELCGWIEESMDDVVLRCAIRHLKLEPNRKHCRKEIIGKTYGFDYGSFRYMLVRILGLINVERIESTVDPVKYQIFESKLESLKAARNREAHTHLKGMTRTVDAPSQTLAQFQPIYEGLVEFDRVIRSRTW